jgi:hypothetical protein
VCSSDLAAVGRVRLRALYPELGGIELVRTRLDSFPADATVQFFAARALARAGGCAEAADVLGRAADSLRSRDEALLQHDLEVCLAGATSAGGSPEVVAGGASEGGAGAAPSAASAGATTPDR